MNHNLYIIPENTPKNEIDYQNIYAEINKLSEKISNLKQENDEIWKAREYFKEQLDTKDKESENLKKKNEKLIEEKEKIEEEKNRLLEENKKIKEELFAIKSRKIYKIMDKMTNHTKFKF